MNYRAFLRNRFARVMPLHWVMCFLFVIVFSLNELAGHTRNEGYVVWGDLPAHILAIHSLGLTGDHSWNFPSWSISAEMIAYTLLPVFLLLGRRVPAWIFLVAAMVCLAAAYLVLQANGVRMTRMTHDFGVIRAILGFAIGVAVLHVVRRSPTLGAVAPLGFAATALVILTGIAFRIEDVWILLLLPPLIGFGAGLAMAVRPTILRHRLLVWLGERSYSIYMVHVLVIVLMQGILETVGLFAFPVVVYVSTLSVILCAAHLLYRVVECPARSWLRAKRIEDARSATL